MISQRMIDQVQACAGPLTNDLVSILITNPRCPSYRALPKDRLVELKDDLYRNLGRWLSSRSRAAVESRYLKLGRERCLAGVPLSEVIFAQSVTKSLLLGFIRRSMPGDTQDVNLEHELVLAISEFFDEVVYWVAEGYEDTRQAREANPSEDAEPATWNPKPKIEPVRAGVGATNERDLAVSRGGDVGGTPG